MFCHRYPQIMMPSSWVLLVATTLCTSKPSHLSTATLQALQQHAARPKPVQRIPSLQHGWSGAPRHQVNLGTAQHDSACAPAPTVPRRRKHELASVTRMRILLTKLGSEFYDLQVEETDGRMSKLWESIAHSGYCTNPKCTSEYRRGRELR
jgi:hypothetical protein